jgi:hypothetical protein
MMAQAAALEPPVVKKLAMPAKLRELRKVEKVERFSRHRRTVVA